MLKKYMLILVAMSSMLFLCTSLAKKYELDPSDDAVSACVAHSEHDGCSYRTVEGLYVTGKCVTYDGNHKACSDVRPGR